MSWKPELEAALEAARQAGIYLRDQYERFERIADAPASISTVCDRESQEIILKHLHGVFPRDGLRAEEATPTLAAVGEAGERLWIVDPIDGTRGFAQKNGEFSVMIALAQAGKIVVGVVAEPVLNRLTYATAGGGCWSRDQDAVARCLVGSRCSLNDAVLTQSRSRGGYPTVVTSALMPARIRETYSAGIKLALVARGEADVYVSTYDGSHDWDVAAGHVLVSEAGGVVTSLRGELLSYPSPSQTLPYGLLAANPVLHDLARQAMSHLD